MKRRERSSFGAGCGVDGDTHELSPPHRQTLLLTEEQRTHCNRLTYYCISQFPRVSLMFMVINRLHWSSVGFFEPFRSTDQMRVRSF